LAATPFKTRQELDPHLSRVGKAARLSIEQRHETAFARLHAMDDKLLKAHPELAHAAEFADLSPAARDAFRHRTQFEAWAYGTQKMRDAALKDPSGRFVPTPEEVKEFGSEPLGVLDYAYVNDYEPLIQTKAQRAAARAAAPPGSAAAGGRGQFVNDRSAPNQLDRFRYGKLSITKLM
jgi:hypothetical protein